MFKTKKRKFESNVKLENSKLSLLKQVKRNYFHKHSPERISKSLFGHCSFFDGVYYFNWESNEFDFCVSYPYTEIPKSELRALIKLSKKQKKELYVTFHCTPKGPGSAVLTFILSNIAAGLLQELGKDIYAYFKNKVIDKICIKEKDSSNEVIEVYTDGDTDSPTYLYLEQANSDTLDSFENIILENLLAQRKPARYTPNGIVYESKLSHHLIDVNA